MEIIYQSYSFRQKFKIWTSRITMLCIIFAALINIKLNPFGLSFFIFILFLWLSFIKEDKIIIYNDHLIFKKLYLLNLFCVIKQKIYLNDLIKIEASTYKFHHEIIDFFTQYRLNKRLYIYLKDEKSVTIKTVINIEELTEIETIINERIKLNNKN